MRVFIAGASGALGRRLVPRLLEAGHAVVGTHHSAAGGERLRQLGATPVQLDLLDAEAVRRAVLAHRPEVVVHEATALAHVKFGRNMDKVGAQTGALRTRGTDLLLAAAREAGVRRFVAQSVAGFGRYARVGGPVKTEDDPVEPAPPRHFEESAAALAHLERAVLDFGGIALRYGVFYGDARDGTLEPVRRRQFPIIGDGGGIWSWIHLDDAAAATALAVEHDGPAILNVVDDEPAAVRDWLPVLAQALGAPPPRHLPVWLARPLAGEFVTRLCTEARGASNARARRELGWTLRHPSWRSGFFDAYRALRQAPGAGPPAAAPPRPAEG
jgi:nucleoside-diphosphate-sugar epimerase